MPNNLSLQIILHLAVLGYRYICTTYQISFLSFGSRDVSQISYDIYFIFKNSAFYLYKGINWNVFVEYRFGIIRK